MVSFRSLLGFTSLSGQHQQWQLWRGGCSCAVVLDRADRHSCRSADCDTWNLAKIVLPKIVLPGIVTVAAVLLEEGP
jgi:hypothetical protein